MIVKKRDSFEVKVTVFLFKENEMYVAYCPALELSSYGDDEKDAKEGFDDALDIFLQETQKKGTLEKELLKLGWRLQQRPKPNYKPPTLASLPTFKHRGKHRYAEKVAIPVA